jgi:hypothetical protein
VIARSERRQAFRATPGVPELQRVRIRAGPEVTALDYSELGVCVASALRLLPGRPCTVMWPALEGTPSASGVIVRSTVGKLDAAKGVLYHAAIRFSQPAAFLGVAATREG